MGSTSVDSLGGLVAALLDEVAGFSNCISASLDKREVSSLEDEPELESGFAAPPLPVFFLTAFFTVFLCSDCFSVESELEVSSLEDEPALGSGFVVPPLPVPFLTAFLTVFSCSDCFSVESELEPLPDVNVALDF